MVYLVFFFKPDFRWQQHLISLLIVFFPSSSGFRSEELPNRLWAVYRVFLGMLPSFSFDSGADEIEFRAEGTALAAEYRVFFVYLTKFREVSINI